MPRVKSRKKSRKSQRSRKRTTKHGRYRSSSSVRVFESGDFILGYDDVNDIIAFGHRGNVKAFKITGTERRRRMTVSVSAEREDEQLEIINETVNGIIVKQSGMEDLFMTKTTNTQMPTVNHPLPIVYVTVYSYLTNDEKQKHVLVIRDKYSNDNVKLFTGTGRVLDEQEVLSERQSTRGTDVSTPTGDLFASESPSTVPSTWNGVQCKPYNALVTLSWRNGTTQQDYLATMRR